MVGKLMIGGGVALCLLGGVIMLGIATATQMTHASYGRTVQHYAEQNAAIGDPLALGMIALGATLAAAGLVVTLVRRVSR